jgi:hypothetical protein
MSTTSIARHDLDLPLVVTQLMKGVVYQDTHERAWRHLIPLQARVRDHVAVIGLTLVIDESRGMPSCARVPRTMSTTSARTSPG